MASNAMIQINLLPWRELARTAKKQRFIYTYMVILAITFFALVCFHMYLSHLASAQLELNTYLQSQINDEQASLNAISKQLDEKRAIETQLQFIIDLYKQNYQAMQLLNELTNVIPTTILVNKIIRNKEAVILTGIAESDSDVTNFMKDIAKSPIFNQPVLSGISGEKSAITDSTKRYFQIDVTLKDKSHG